ncbi:MAG: hypothetical protein IJH34_17115, partial [Romboutsia sp.]|nr:hypothetical protein [Romboutsia sp.]
ELSESGEDAVYDYIDSCYFNSEIDENDYILDVIKSKFTDKELEEYEDYINDFVVDNIGFVFPKEFIWDSEVLVNITITGYNDYDYDFSHNTFYKDDNGDSRLCNGAIKWLIEQQGYNVNDFEKELNIVDMPFTNEFFSSVYNEILNTTTSLNSLVVSTKMTLKELIDLKKSHSNSNFKTLKVGKNCDIGLVDFWQGAGSVL